jgi:hypothetical protein
MKLNKLLCACLVGMFCLPVAASDFTAADLGGRLTPLGGDASANADGSIPAYTGGLSTTAAAILENGYMADPFAGEQPLLTITKANYDAHKDRLTPGQIALLERYPDQYKINVYPTHRSAAVPAAVAEKVKQNAVNARLIEGGYAVENFQTGTPFPLATQALEMVWNHAMRYRGGSSRRQFVQLTPQTGGSFTPIVFMDLGAEAKELSDYNPEKAGFTQIYLKQYVLSPARLAGTALLAHESSNEAKQPRRAWIYNAGQRRVRMAPQVAYDGPGTAADGLRTSDNYDMYNGSPDRYDWKVVGKKEVYVPYNSYKLASPSLRYEDIGKAGVLNPEHTRYELHRVWQVEGTLKSGARHVYAKRVFFLDEDTWQIVLADHYDSRGALWRVAEGHAIQYFNKQVPWYAAEALYDLISGRYLVLGLHNQEKREYEFGVKYTSGDFSPAALRQAGVR